MCLAIVKLAKCERRKMSKLLFKDEEYTFKELWKFYSTKRKYYLEGEVLDVSSGEVIDISNLHTFRERFLQESLEDLNELDIDNWSVKKRLKYEKDKFRLSDLERLYNNNTITPEELKELIMLKYKTKDIKDTMCYEHYAFLNLKTESPPLSDAEIGKFYKMLLQMSQKANSLLTTKDVRSQPVSVDDLSILFNSSKSNIYKFLKKLKKLNIVKTFSMNEKEYMSINPKYAINGKITSHTYFLFKEDMKELFPNIPEEIIKLWEFEFLSSTVLLT
jgi:predicted transcriptional regulator